MSPIVLPTGYRIVDAIVISLLVACLFGCAGGGTPEVKQGPPPASWQPVLSPGAIETVRKTFPRFGPELFSSSVPAANLTPENFSPAKFFGETGVVGDPKLTPNGITVHTNGFDALDHPEFLPAQGTYFDRQNNPYVFELGFVSFYPQWEIESRLQLSATPGALKIEVDRRKSRLDLAEVDRIMLDVRDALSVRLPQVASVDPRRALIVFEPTVFFVKGSNFGDTWAGGATTPLGNGTYQIKILIFYINSQRRVMDWREFLIHEAINFYVISVGRPDLAI